MKIELATGKDFDSHDKKIAILPVGSIERHGDFLPLGTDILVPLKLAEDVEKILSVDVYPPIPYGVSPYLAFAGGTISVESDIYKMYIENIVKEILRQGYRAIIILNGHGGNTNILTLICQDIVKDSDRDIKCVVIDWWRELGLEARRMIFKSPGHAGGDETSIMLYLYSKYVDKEYSNKTEIKRLERPLPKYYSKKIYSVLYPHAYNGDPSEASKEKGKEWYDAVLNELIDIIKMIMNTL
jgi:creatinine amidohydrolase